ncbi:GNAT family N-acetyltransferase [Streptomyces sp. NPDC049879]|uniref:GNAT family N-acetyltransferase n=1 Tax=Streptomyces sp. NPDC049879 TaxID=3365598 RepID=UPI0037BD7A09
MSEMVGMRDVGSGDLEVFLAYEHDPEAARRARFPPREREAFMTHWTTRILADPAVFVQAVTVEGAVAGNVVAWWHGDRRFIGYWFGREYWGRGIGTRALRLFLEREETRPLYADPYAVNAGSVRLLEKVGFQRTDTVGEGEDEQVVLVLGAPAGDA